MGTEAVFEVRRKLWALCNTSWYGVVGTALPDNVIVEEAGEDFVEASI